VLVQVPWDEVRGEMINEKGLSVESADLIGQYVCLHGTLFCLYCDLAANLALYWKLYLTYIYVLNVLNKSFSMFIQVFSFILIINFVIIIVIITVIVIFVL